MYLRVITILDNRPSHFEHVVRLTYSVHNIKWCTSGNDDHHRNSDKKIIIYMTTVNLRHIVSINACVRTRAVGKIRIARENPLLAARVNNNNVATLIYK